MAFDAYLKIEGIPGEATDAGHKDWIELTGYEFGGQQPASATASSAGGGSSERVALKRFTVRKRVDMASPKLFQQMCQGTHIKKVQLQVHRAGDNPLNYFTVLLEDSIIGDYSHIATATPTGEDAAEGDLPIEQLSFDYGTITVTYHKQDRTTGDKQGNVVGGWSRKENRAYAGQA